jgi:SAM-dependent methyltransferase
VLDLACGPGRHSAALRRRGALVVGLDLSMPLLLTARHRGAAPLLRGDMRALALRGESFNAVLNLFTSFGYFGSDHEHDRVLREVARVLRRGGVFVLDFLNAPAVRASLVPRDDLRLGQAVVVQERRLSADGRFVVKTIHLGGEGRSFIERVRLYERPDLEGMMVSAGLVPEAAFGDYDGQPHAPGSPRLLLLARRQ